MYQDFLPTGHLISIHLIFHQFLPHNFPYKEPEQFSSDDEIELLFCIFSRVDIPIYTVSSDSDTD